MEKVKVKKQDKMKIAQRIMAGILAFLMIFSVAITMIVSCF